MAITGRFCVLAACVALVAVGCSSEKKIPLTKVLGTVTFDGQPLKDGSIVFDPEDGKLVPAQGGIVDGKYEFESPAGPKIVRIQATRLTDKKDEYGSIISESYIPQQYNTKSTLKAVVAEGKENSFPFELTSKGK